MFACCVSLALLWPASATPASVDIFSGNVKTQNKKSAQERDIFSSSDKPASRPSAPSSPEKTPTRSTKNPRKPRPNDKRPPALTMEALVKAMKNCNKPASTTNKSAAPPGMCAAVANLPPSALQQPGELSFTRSLLRFQQRLAEATRKAQSAVAAYPDLNPSPVDKKRQKDCALPTIPLDAVLQLFTLTPPPIMLSFSPLLPNGRVNPTWRATAAGYISLARSWSNHRIKTWTTLAMRLQETEDGTSAWSLVRNYLALDAELMQFQTTIWVDGNVPYAFVRLQELAKVKIPELERQATPLMNKLLHMANTRGIPDPAWWNGKIQALDRQCNRLWKHAGDYLTWLSSKRAWQRRAAARLLTPALKIWAHCHGFKLQTEIGSTWAHFKQPDIPPKIQAQMRATAYLMPRWQRWLQESETWLAAGGTALLSYEFKNEKGKQRRVRSGSAGRNLREALANMGGWANKQWQTLKVLQRWERALAKETVKRPKLRPLLKRLRRVINAKTKRLTMYPVIFRRGTALLEHAPRCENLEACYSRTLARYKNTGITFSRKWRAAIEACGAWRPYCRKVRWHQRLGAFRGALMGVEMGNAWADTTDIPLLLATVQKKLGLDKPPAPEKCSP